MEKTHQIPIWFFIGCLLALYGLMILGYGIYSLFHPPLHPAALHELHPDVWWGALLSAIGGIYTVKYWPWSHGRN
jgi:hypothetical protein